jgi:mono/diheme cytochrome c family protein
MPSFGQALTGEAVWKLAAYVKSLGPGTGENQEGGRQAAESEGGGKQAGGSTGD